MAARKAHGPLSCVECGENISDRTLWVDDGGFLCRHCAVLTRYRRMRREVAWVPRRGADVGHRDKRQ